MEGARNSKLYVTGDIHGEKARFVYDKFAYNKDLAKGDYLFVAGDFGFVFNGSSQEKVYLDRLAREKPFTICFVDGNHENFPKINDYPVKDWNGGKIHVLRTDEDGNPKIVHLMRGQVFDIEGVSILALGGAKSTDRIYRTEGKSLWAELEMLSEEDKLETTRNLGKRSNSVDVILTHEAPAETVSKINMTYKIDSNQNFLEYIRETVDYKKWYFGHHHIDKEMWLNQYAMYFDVRDLVTGEIISRG
ncbi:MAG: metallophosphoesterase [Clostridia bacterium]|nr:metallophosphoesterase [Clostridia bacterium]